MDPAILGPLSADVRPKAPGMKYKHYAPKADLTLVEPGTGTERESGGRQVTRAEQKTGADWNTGAAPETGLDETQLQAMIRKVRELSGRRLRPAIRWELSVRTGPGAAIQTARYAV